MPYDLGDLVPLSVDVRDSAGVLANAGAITLTITLPDGTATSPSVTNPPSVTGTYVYNFTPTQAGRHIARWVATGANASAFSDAFDVREASPLYIVSLADAKRELNLTTVDAARDEELRTYIEGATVIIESKVGPVVPRTFVERNHPSSDVIQLRRPSPISLTSVEGQMTGGTTYTVGDLDLDPDTGVVRKLDGGRFTGGPFKVTYRAGRAVIPANIVQAAKDLIRINFRPQQGGNLSRYDRGGIRSADVDGTVNRDYGMFVPHSVMANLAPQQDAGVA